MKTLLYWLTDELDLRLRNDGEVSAFVRGMAWMLVIQWALLIGVTGLYVWLRGG